MAPPARREWDPTLAAVIPSYLSQALWQLALVLLVSESSAISPLHTTAVPTDREKISTSSQIPCPPVGVTNSKRHIWTQNEQTDTIPATAFVHFLSSIASAAGTVLTGIWSFSCSLFNATLCWMISKQRCVRCTILFCTSILPISGARFPIVVETASVLAIWS